MIRIGYVRLRDAGSAAETAALKAMGCHVVRAEEPAGPGGDDSVVLETILDFAGEGDELVVSRLDQLAATCRGRLDVIDRLERRGAHLFIVEHQLRSDGAAKGDRAMRPAAIIPPVSVAAAPARPSDTARDSRRAKAACDAPR